MLNGLYNLPMMYINGELCVIYQCESRCEELVRLTHVVLLSLSFFVVQCDLSSSIVEA